MTTGNQYKLSFTAAGLSLGESVKIAEVFLDCMDWDITRATVREKNLLQSRTIASAKRTYQEISRRLGVLTNQQLELLVEGNLSEQKQILWFAVCTYYQYIREFAIEVVHEKFLVMDYELTDFDYDAFFNSKIDWHEELDQITETTKRKLKTVIFRMLREAEITTTENRIIETILSNRVIEILKPAASYSYQIFPFHTYDIE